MRNLIFIGIALIATSCLKKIEEVETANNNIFDPEYAGEQWWVYEDVFMFTDQNNNTYVRFEIGIPEENAPELKPPQIDLAVTVNGGNTYYTEASVNYTGNYKGVVNIFPTGETNFCIDVGVYVEEEGLIINSFSECKAL